MTFTSRQKLTAAALNAAFAAKADASAVYTKAEVDALLAGLGGGVVSDTTPTAFSFTDVTSATLSTVYTSNTITVAGINAATAISITGGTYSKNGESYTSTAGTVVNGDTVAVRVTSSGSSSTAASAVLTIGGVSDTYSVTTALPLAIASIGIGQSLSQSRGPLVTTVPETGVYTMVGGVEAQRFSDYSVSAGSRNMDYSDFASLTPLTESAAKESWGSGLGYQIMQHPNVAKTAFFSAGFGGADYVLLKRGSPRWSWALTALDTMVKTMASEGYEVRPDWTWTQGEADAEPVAPGGGVSEEPVTQAEYVTILTQLLADIRLDTSLIYGQVRTDDLLFVTPLLTSVYQAGCRHIQNAQVQAAQNVSGIVLLPSPGQVYAGYDSDQIHRLGPAIRLYAEAAALVKRKVWAGESWSPLHMVSANRVGTTVTVVFNKPIEIDTTLVADMTAVVKQKYGFEFFGDANPISVTNVTVSGSTATLTLAGLPSGTVREVRMSQQFFATYAFVDATESMPRSNIRATTSLGVAKDGTVLYDYAVPQSIVCPDDGSSAAAYNFAYVTGDRTASIAVSASPTSGWFIGTPSSIVDGSLTSSTFYFGGGATAGNALIFDFGAAKVINEAKWYQDGAQTHGVWNWQGSSDGTTWADIGASFTLGGATRPQLLTSLESNGTGYRYYKLLGVSGTTSSGPYLNEIEFQVGTPV